MIAITEKNINSIFGKLRKFFMSDSHGYIEWHNFDCGKRRKVKPYLGLTPNYFNKPVNFTLVHDVKLNDGKSFIRINMDKYNGFCVYIGDGIDLKSGKIIIKQKWNATNDYSYIYQVFQACKPTKKQLKELYWRECSDEALEDLLDDIA